jgi:hypothetical protein
MTTTNAINIGTGNAGEVLTSNGAGVAPTFQTGGGGGGGITTIACDSGTATGSTITFAGESTNLFSAVSSFVNLSFFDAHHNTAFGQNALRLVNTGAQNIAIGSNSGSSITLGSNNISFGQFAGSTLVDGNSNINIGASTGGNVSSGINNINLGDQSGSSNDTNDSYNINIGSLGQTGENHTIRLGESGTYTQTFIQGIFGVTVTGSAVLIDSNGKMGTVVSSIRYKEDIIDLKDYPRSILDLRPVSFKYKNRKDETVNFGLIAEEVEKNFPELVLRDKEGTISSVKYHELPALLLLEIQKLQKRIEALEKGR